MGASAAQVENAGLRGQLSGLKEGLSMGNGMGMQRHCCAGSPFLMGMGNCMMGMASQMMSMFSGCMAGMGFGRGMGMGMGFGGFGGRYF